MEIKKEDFVRFRIVDTFFYALPASFFDDKATVAEIIEEEVKEERIAIKREEQFTEELEAEKASKIVELAAIAKAKEIEDLKAKLASLEE